MQIAFLYISTSLIYAEVKPSMLWGNIKLMSTVGLREPIEIEHTVLSCTNGPDMSERQHTGQNVWSLGCDDQAADEVQVPRTSSEAPDSFDAESSTSLSKQHSTLMHIHKHIHTLVPNKTRLNSFIQNQFLIFLLQLNLKVTLLSNIWCWCWLYFWLV